MCEQCLIDKIIHIFSINRIFCNLEGGYGGPPPENFENQECMRSHFWSFCKNNFTFRKWTISEDIAPIYCMLFFKYKI